MVAFGQNWTCPYCGHAQVIGDRRRVADLISLRLENCRHGDIGYYAEAISCANDKCRELSLEFFLVRRGPYRPNGGFEIQGTIQHWRLLPSSFAQPQPDCIPEPLRRDYEEACAIRDLSPKASATITRRCIQGIIRDFCDISKNRLIDEIKELRRRVDAGQAPPGVQADTVDAIDHVREIGNIGAHMEADINVIVDVDPGEAQTLIELTELLFEEWYVAQWQRTERLKKLGMIAGEKKLLKQQGLLPPPAEKPKSALPIEPD